MENNLTETMNKLTAEPGVVGCVFANSHGLCVGNKGKASVEAAGVVTAIMNQAMKLGASESASKAPVVLLDYGDNQQCLIYRTHDVTGAVYKQKK